MTSAGTPRLGESDFRRLSRLVHDLTGIDLAPAKKILVETRLRQRVEELELPSFAAYCDFVLGPRGEAELAPLVDRITTNKTDFFRESSHFDYLVEEALPALAALDSGGRRQPFSAWSAGCSSGEEPYTLAMVLSEYAGAHPGFRYSILATDVSTRVLEKGRTAVYSLDVVAPVPAPLRRKYLLASKDPARQVVRLAPEIRAGVRFRHLDFMHPHYGLTEPVEIIFCRNVMIYFDRPTQGRLVNRFASHLRPGGYLFVGHSETLNGLDAPLAAVAPSIYRKPV